MGPLMRAARPVGAGASSRLEVVRLPIPVPTDEEVLIRVSRAGVNLSDIVGPRTGINRFTGHPLMDGEIPGGEVAGVREDTGERVVAVCESGGYAEWTTAPKGFTFPIPDGVDDDVALALLVSGLTAWFLYRPFARLEGGETVVVPAAAGAVGSTALQLGRLFGAGRVIATASTPAKRSVALELGADVAVEDEPSGLSQRLLAANDGRPIDIIFEMAGGPAFEQSIASLARFGRLVVYGTSSGETGLLDTRSLIPGSQTISGFWPIDCLRAGLADEPLAQLLHYQVRGELRVAVGPTYALEQARTAQRDLVARRTSGKVLLDPTNSPLP
jgi:NADPH2:quinone reductase